MSSKDPAMRSPQLSPKGDGPLPDLTSGAMWVATAAAGLAALALPGADRSHLVWTLVLAAFAFAWGGFSLWMGLTQRTMSIGLRAVVTAAMMPIVALALWATGGEDSFLEPVLLFTALFIGYFFEARHAWPLLGLFIATYAAPLAYDSASTSVGYPSRTLTFAVSVVGAAIAVQFLKRRLVMAEAHQRTMAQRDPLTGLRNRRAFDHALARSIDRCALVVFDFDGFKAINDTHGHLCGSSALVEAAAVIRISARETDIVARFGGDEFALVLPDTGSEGAAAVGERVREKIAVHGFLHSQGLDIKLTVSVGVATLPDVAASAEQLIQAADEAMYWVKDHGKNGIYVAGS
jgi:diguanylate cyclase (GGDEF)-like protein